MSYPTIKAPNGSTYTPQIGNTAPPVGSPVWVHTANGPKAGYIASGGVPVVKK